eukprot:3728874-Prymnesium_polylepis.1
MTRAMLCALGTGNKEASAIASHNRVLTRLLLRDILPLQPSPHSALSHRRSRAKQSTTCIHGLPQRHHARHGAGSSRARARSHDQ